MHPTRRLVRRTWNELFSGIVVIVGVLELGVLGLLAGHSWSGTKPWSAQVRRLLELKLQTL